MNASTLVKETELKNDSTAFVSEAEDQLFWYAVYTRSRHEKCLDFQLRRKGIETFLPLRRFHRRWSDRWRIVEEPLFKGYLFVRIPWKEKIRVLETKGAVRFLGRGPTAEPVPEKELFAIRRFLEEKIAVDPFPYLQTGMRVYIRSGPFKGIEGFIVRKHRHSRLVISLDLLQQSVSVEIDEACVEPV